MNSPGAFTVAPNAARGGGPRPEISVLVPFYETSPAALVRDLLARAEGAGGAVEVIVADDGSRSDEPGRGIAALLRDSPVPGALIRAARNVGRARIRNILAGQAAGGYLLYIDCDMRPAGPRFLETYLDLCRGDAPDIVYGGFTMAVDAANPDPLAAYFGKRSDCLPADRRRAAPAKYTYTNNLLVRRAVMLETPFDEGFAGWGWEDVEWALRAAETWRIDHIDNPVINPATASAAELVAKFGGSARNFERLMRRHPDAAAGYPIHRASRIARRIPLAGAAAPLFRSIALDRTGLCPVPLRYLALKLYRACMYRTIFAAPGGEERERPV